MSASPIAFTVSMIIDKDGKASAVAAVIRDDTARFTEERALRKRIMELESAIK